MDPQGDVYVADTGNNRIEEFSSTGSYMYKFGSETMKEPQGIAVDSEGHVWIADTGNNRVSEYAVEKNPEKVTYLRVFGKVGSGSEQFSEPQGIATGAEGNVYVADTGNSRIDEYTSAGKYVRNIGSAGSGNGQLKTPHGIATDSTGEVWVADTANNRIEAFSPTGTFVQTFGVKGEGEGKLLSPHGIAIDSEGNAWVVDTANNRVQVWTAHGSGYGGTGKATSNQTIYYSTAANTKYERCGEHAEWAGLPCQTQPAAQPTGSLPKLPVTTYTYNLWDEPETTTSTSGTSTRTTTQTHDAAGRPETITITANTGTAMPGPVSDQYNTENGALAVQSMTSEGKTQKITGTQNTLGEPVTYTDASGNEATIKYDIDGRPETFSDGKGSQTYGYDPTSGDETSLKDSAAGTFTASYDANNELVSEGYPNGMSANYTLDSTGREVAVEYVKTTHCTSSCVWFSDSIVPSAQGHWASQTSSLSSENYTEDNDGRITEVQDTPAGKGCVTRLYTYDVDTNRTSLTTREPGTEGKCATEGGTNEKHTYDEADRLNDANVAYSPFGDITALPAADAGGNELTSSYYADNQLASQTQNKQTIGYQLDPAGRTSETIATGTHSATTTNHYAGPGNTPAWTSNTTGEWTRNITGISGHLVATQSNSETPVLQLSNLHGDIIATAYLSETATGLASSADTSEYGVPTTSLPPKYSWLGALQLPTELPSGVVAMGARSYVPQLGRFLQPDPIPGAAANAYTYTNGNPLTENDPTGESTQPPAWEYELAQKLTEEGSATRAAEEAAARAAAEAAARAAAERAASLDGFNTEWAAYNGAEEEWEEWWEEEDEYENASDRQGAQPGKGESQVEPAILVQPLVSEEGNAQSSGSNSGEVRVCQTDGVTARDACEASLLGTIRHALGRVWHMVKSAAVTAIHSLGTGDAVCTDGFDRCLGPVQLLFDADQCSDGDCQGFSQDLSEYF